MRRSHEEVRRHEEDNDDDETSERARDAARRRQRNRRMRATQTNGAEREFEKIPKFLFAIYRVFKANIMQILICRSKRAYILKILYTKKFYKSFYIEIKLIQI